MAQFDVYANPSPKSRSYYPYIVDIQNNYLSELETRIVIPLGLASFFGKDILTRLQIEIAFEHQALVLMVPQISSIPRGLLKEPVGSIAHLQHEVISALDFAISGF